MTNTFLNLFSAARSLVKIALQWVPLLTMALCSSGALFLTACGGSSSTTPPPAPPISVSVSPTRGGLTVGQSLNFTAMLANDVNHAGVTWSATAGSFKNQTANSAVYVAPASAGVITVTATSGADTAKSASATLGVTDLAGVETYHNDISRLGVNAREYALTKSNVTTATFGKLFSCAVDAAVYAQPLWVANVTINGGTHNVVFVATQHNTLYAFDADAGPCVTYWQTGTNNVNSLIPPGETWVTNTDENGCLLIVPDIGILGTPVIDGATATVYLVTSTKTTSGSMFQQRLHALDLATGKEKFGGPTEIQAAVPGTGAGSSAGLVHFDPMLNSQRPALLLENGHILISWASYCDFGPYHGWLMAYNAASLAQEAVFNVSPNASAGGIWMSGSGPAADASGNIYLATGNGTWNGADAFGDTILKLALTAGSPSLTVADYFTPHEQASLDASDSDLGSGGVLLLPDSASVSGHPHLLVQGSKNGAVYLIDRDKMGHICSTCTTIDTQIVQDLPGALTGLWAAPTYWNGTLYFGETDATPNLKFLQAFSLGPTGPNFISTSPTSTTAHNFTYTYPGPTSSISTDGSASAILWAIDSSAFGTTEGPLTRAAGPAILHAFDAGNLAAELWNSSQAPANRDVAGFAVKFTVPTVANGKVYVGTRGNDDTLGHGTVFGELDVYGLLPN